MISKRPAMTAGKVGAAVAGLVVIAGLGCKNSGTLGPRHAAKAESAAARAGGPGISLECVAERIRNAPAPFHWSYERETTASGTEKWEADVTPDSIEGKATGSNGTHAIHATRANAAAWNEAVIALVTPLPGGTFSLVQNSSGEVRAGTEKIGGEDTVKYDIDTARDSPADASLIKRTMGDGGFIRGTAWVTGDGCLVKLQLDAEQHLSDGTVEKEHYEAAITPK